MIVQGDVFLVKVKEIPEDAAEVKAGNRGFVLAEGEATGHAHAIRDVAGAKMYEKDGTLYLRVEDEQIEVSHEEHLPVTVAKGLWKVGRVREYDHFNYDSADDRMNVLSRVRYVAD